MAVWLFIQDQAHDVKSVRIRSFSGPYTPAFGVNMEIYRVNIRIQSKLGKYGPENLRIPTLFTHRIFLLLTHFWPLLQFYNSLKTPENQGLTRNDTKF